LNLIKSVRPGRGRSRFGSGFFPLSLGAFELAVKKILGGPRGALVCGRFGCFLFFPVDVNKEPPSDDEGEGGAEYFKDSGAVKGSGITGFSRRRIFKAGGFFRGEFELFFKRFFADFARGFFKGLAHSHAPDFFSMTISLFSSLTVILVMSLSMTMTASRTR
jgi:hypothetical protein